MQKAHKEIKDHLREDIQKVEDPQLKAMFETAAEVLGGLEKAFRDYEQKNESVWRPYAKTSEACGYSHRQQAKPHSAVLVLSPELEGWARNHQPEDCEHRGKSRKAEGEPDPENSMIVRRQSAMCSHRFLRQITQAELHPDYGQPK